MVRRMVTIVTDDGRRVTVGEVKGETFIRYIKGRHFTSLFRKQQGYSIDMGVWDGLRDRVNKIVLVDDTAGETRQWETDAATFTNHAVSLPNIKGQRTQYSLPLRHWRMIRER